MQFQSSIDQLLQDKQKTIQKLTQQNNQLISENQKLFSQIDQLTLSRNHYKNVLHQDPLYLIFNQNNIPNNLPNVPIYNSNQELSKRLNLYKNKVRQLQKQLQKTDNVLDSKKNQLKILEREKRQMEQIIESNQRQIRDLQNQNDMTKKQNNNLLNTIKHYQNKWKLLNQSVLKIQSQLDTNNYKLTTLNHLFNQIQKSWLQSAKLIINQSNIKQYPQTQKIHQLTQKFKNQSQIMEDFGRQLDKRNQQIAQLLTMNNKSNSSQTIHYDQHTLLEAINSSKLKQQRYKELLQKYRQLHNHLQQSINQKQKLQKQYTLLKEQMQIVKGLSETNKQLKRETQTLKISNQKLNIYLDQTIGSLEALLQENEAFQSYLKNQYGNNLYQAKLQEQRDKYNARKKERQSNELWGNITELITMNRKLREKLGRKNF